MKSFVATSCRPVTAMIGMLILSAACSRVTVELTSTGIDNVMGDGPSLYDCDVIVYTRYDTLYYQEGSWAGLDETKRFLLGVKGSGVKRDSIPLGDIRYLEYDMGLALTDDDGVRWEMGNKDWRVRYSRGKPVGIVSVDGQVRMFPREHIRSMTAIGSYRAVTYMLWFFAFFGALGLIGGGLGPPM